MTLLKRHTALVHFISHLNRQVVSVELFIFVILNIPFHIYLCTKIIFGIHPHLLVLIVTLIQLSAASVSNVAAIHLNRRLHYAQKYLPSAQIHLLKRSSSSSSPLSSSSPSFQTSEKIKVLSLYEQLNCATSQLGYTAGPIGIITPNTTFNVSFLNFKMTLNF